VWKKSELPDGYQQLRSEGYSEIASLVMARAGVNSKEKAEEFLNSEMVHDPAKIRNIDTVSEIIWEHIYENKKICIFGDYDADGITGAAILYLALRKMGADVSVRLPDRIYEGYGISMQAVREEIASGVQLFITIDNGIKAIDEVEEIRRQGCKSIVLDHHQPGDVLPDADALIDLWIEGESYPFRELTGSGLAWKVACHMLTQIDEYQYGMELVDLAAIGTIADVAPLIGENRSIVKRAIKRIRSCWYDRQGVIALLGHDRCRITAEDIAFTLAPCINAPGRLDVKGADLPLLLLLEDKPEIAKLLAERISDVNANRKRMQKDWCSRIEQEAERMVQEGDKVLVLLADGAPSGITGLIAGNLKEKFNRPTVVFSPKEDREHGTIWTGSGRSVKGFHLLNALKNCDDLFLAYGGHELAAGMSITADTKILSELRRRMNIAAEALTEEMLVPIIEWDLTLNEEAQTKELYDELDMLEPFGEGVRKPVFKMRIHLSRKGHTLMGNDKSHVKLFAEKYSAVGFFIAEKYIKAELSGVLDGLGYPYANYYNGRFRQEFKLIDFEPIAESSDKGRNEMI